MILKGIDVSEHQGSINWSQVKASDVQFAMIRGGYGRNNVDKYFHANAKGATAAGIPIGMYWFSYALNVDMARNEAKYAVALAKQYKITWPIAFDLEYDTVSYAAKNGVTITKNMATQMAKAFCEEIKASGYTPMNYTNPDYLNRYFDRSQLPYDVWLAQYASQPSISDMSIWQYSSSGSVPGISGRCDMNYAYKDYGKKNNEVVYWGIVDNIQNTDGQSLYQYTLKYITNLFNQNIKLENESLLSSTGVEDFIKNAISTNFTNNTDTFVNLTYLEVNVMTHTKKQISVSNVQDNIYNLHTWMTNCTQNYDIVYSFSIVNKKLQMTIEVKSANKELIDVNAQPISNYTEVFETDVVSKVVVLTDTNTYTLYLLNDRTTTTDMNNKNRAEGKIETVYTQNYEDAPQMALDTIKANSYNHNITFAYYNRFIQVGTPIAIKTKESLIYNTYISAIKITQNKFIEYTCGNIRINFIDKFYSNTLCTKIITKISSPNVYMDQRSSARNYLICEFQKQMRTKPYSSNQNTFDEKR